MAARVRNVVVLGIVAAAVTGLGSAAAGANTYRPNKLGDHVPNGCSQSDCTLREALIRANNHDGADKLVLAGGETYKLRRAGIGEDDAETGDLDVNESLKIVSSNNRLAKVDGNEVDRVFQTGITDPVRASFKRIHVTGGDGIAGGSGGGISGGQGTVRILNSRVSGNTSGLGAGILAAESTVINKTTVSGNGDTGVGEGGGLTVIGDARATVRNSTIRGNQAVFGAGIEVEVSGASLKLVNSTLTKNEAGASGGGIQAFQADVIEVMSSTIARNTAGSFGGGLNRQSADLFTVRNSIIALNDAGTGPDCNGGFGAIERNLLTDLSGCTGFSDPPDIVTSNPRLRQLADNGGPTKTIALRASSPAVNKAGPSSPHRDQRGVVRNNPDIGAYER